MNCKNCGNENIGDFCSKCGQKRINNRLSLKELKADILNNLFNYESNVFKTIFRLITKPRNTITNFFNGKRKSYFNPFKLLLIVLTIKTILENQLVKGLERNNFGENFIYSEYWKLIMILFFVPIISLLSYKFFKGYKYNFTEHLILNTYFLSITNLFVLLIYSLKFIFVFNFNIGLLAFFIEIIVLIWLYTNLFPKKLFRTILKTVLIMFISFIILLIPIIILSKL